MLEKPVNINALGEPSRRGSQTQKGVYLRADKGTVWDPIAQVISTLGESKLDVRVVTQPEDEPGAPLQVMSAACRHPGRARIATTPFAVARSALHVGIAGARLVYGCPRFSAGRAVGRSASHSGAGLSASPLLSEFRFPVPRRDALTRSPTTPSRQSRLRR